MYQIRQADTFVRLSVCPLARTVSPSIAEIDAARGETGARVSISVCKNAATTRTAKAVTVTVYFQRYSQGDECRLLARNLITVICAAVSHPYTLK